MLEEARAELQSLLENQPDLSEEYTYPFVKSEHLALLIEGLRKAGWKPA